MKILIATGIYPPDIGGPATYSALLREELPHRGIGVTILTFGEVRYLPKFIRHLVFFCKAILRGYRCDIIYAQDPVSVGFPSLLASRLMGKRFFIRVAGDYAWEQACQRYGIKDSIDEFQLRCYGIKTSFLKFIQRFVVRNAEKVITPSIYFKNLVSKWNGDRRAVNHIYNGIDFPEIESSKAVLREELSIPENAFVLVSAGRLVPWKGFMKLIEVVRRLSEQSNRYRLYIFGSGPDRELLRQCIDDNGLSNSVFLSGSVPREKLFSYLKASDVFVLNTSFESFSFQIVEAMYSNVPVISTNIGNIPEIVSDGENGILLKPDDVPGIIKSVKRLEEDLIFRDRLVNSAFVRARDFSISNTLDELCKLISK